MLQLKAMGGLALERDGAVLAGPVAQRKRLAILLLLLHAGRTGVTRERLVAWLWPDSDEGRARHALDQSLYVLRRTLGADAFTEGTALRLGPDVVTSDVLSIEAAAAQADDQGVVRAYAGPFLDGVHFSDAPDLERWADGVRARLAALYANALERLALAAETEGDWRSAAGWWRRAVEEDPYATASTVRFVRVLALAGDRGAALRAVEVHEALLRGEGMDPDHRVRAAASANPVIPDAALGRATSDDAPPRESNAPLSPTDRQVRPPVRVPPARPRRRTAAVLAGITVIAIAIGARTWRRDTRLEPRRVLVAPFDNSSSDVALEPLGRMAADWIAEGLQRTGLVEVIGLRVLPGAGGDVRDIARLGRAALVVRGSYYRAGDTVVLHARVEDVATGRLLRSVERIAAPAAKPSGGVEVLRQRVMAALASLVDPRMSAHAQEASPPPTYEAYEEFIAGLDASTRNEFPTTGLHHFQRAAELDTSYALPLLWEALMWRVQGQCERVDSLGGILMKRRDRLAPSDRLMLDRVLARCGGDNERALQAMREAARIAPGWETMYTLAVDAVDAGHPREAIAALAHVDPSRNGLANFDGYWRTGTEALHLLGRHEDELTMARRGRAIRSDAFALARMEARALAALGRSGEAMRLARTSAALLTTPREDAGAALESVAYELDAHGDAASARGLAADAIAWHEQSPPSARRSVDSRAALAVLYGFAGRGDDAMRVATALAAEVPTDPRAVGAMGVVAAMVGDRGTAARADSVLRRPMRHSLGRPELERARIAAVLGRDADAIVLLRAALAAGLPIRAALHADPAFSRLRRERAFVELLSPRG